MIKLIRLTLGNLIALINWLTRGPKLIRTTDQQRLVEQQSANLALYQFELCPFCIKTRRVLHQLNLPIELRDAKNNEKWRDELLQEGGKIKVPCLRIVKDQQVTWMYESSDINHYLKQQFGRGRSVLMGANALIFSQLIGKVAVINTQFLSFQKSARN